MMLKFIHLLPIGIIVTLSGVVLLFNLFYIEEEKAENIFPRQLNMIPPKSRVTQIYFGCLDKSSAQAIENDDYCDCLDGSDEKTTSACSGITEIQFDCKERPAHLIFLSRVNDGIKDCPSGSDELSTLTKEYTNLRRHPSCFGT